jgi:replicative DNA helicase
VSVVDLEAPGESREFGRTPPQDVAAEQSVLGGMMLSKDAIADVVEVLRGPDFYRPAHELVYEAVLDLYGRGEPADAVTVSAELTKRGELARAGGPAYLHTLISSVPTAANAGYYARIVRERAVLRRLVEAGTKIVQLGYATDGGDVDEIVNAAQAEVYSVTERRTSEDYLPLSEIIEGTIDEIEASSHRGDGMVGIPTGFADLDRLTNGLHPGQMIVIAARPAVGKSTVGLDVCRSAAIHHGQAAVIFSLEMSRNEITMRLLSAEARIPLQNMRKGTMREEDWTRLARTMGEVSEAPLFVDDSPNMSLMEIRAKCRRLKQRHGLRLVVVDYLQLMSSGRRVESRQQEVSEFSRALNRGPEQRTDKKPQMSDLRESGCLTAETRVLRADTGAETTLGDLHAAGARDVPVWSLDESLRYVRRHLTHVFPTGRKPVHAVRLASGKQVRATANHPFLTYQGWRPIGELAPGARVAVPRHVCAPESVGVSDDRQVTMLAHMIGDGCRSHEKFVPDAVFSLPKRQIALFLRHLWATDGSVRQNASGRGGRVYYASTSRELVDGVARLLLRFGISCRIRMVTTSNHRPGYTLDISGADDQRRFLGEIGMHGARGLAASALFEVLRSVPSHPNVDTVPGEVWGRVRELLVTRGMTHREFASAMGTRFCGSTMFAHAPSRQRLGRVADVLGDADLELLAVNDVFWDTVVSVEPDGEEDVYDATVLGGHNFVANGIAVHNSIEQDADMVILLHREDMYEKESPRAGEADFIVAKHRNGPTDTITVAFQGHYSRFVDMAS